MEKDFDGALNSFVIGVKKIIDDYFGSQFPNTHATIEHDILVNYGPRFAKIVNVERERDNPRKEIAKSAFAFVAIGDGNNKTLGEWKAGDIFKPASWSTPAKGARGNIFDDDNGLSKIGPYGPQYLRR